MYFNTRSYLNESSNKQIGWIITESKPDMDILEKPKLVETNGRRVVGRGTLQRANKKNRNGRFYDDKDLFPAVFCARTKEMLKTGFGSEDGHPLSPDLARQSTIDPNNVVAFFLNIWTEKDLIKADFRGSNLAIGEAFDQDLRDGFLPAWSLRALGSVENTSRGAEVKGIKVITWDRVYYPSHPEAYTDGVVSESAIWTPDMKIRTKDMNSEENAINENGLIVPIVNQDVLNYIQQESMNFKQIVNEFEVLYDSISMINNNSQVQLANSKTGNVFIVNLETYIHNEIMNYCSK